jgi:hypothetical protein
MALDKQLPWPGDVSMRSPPAGGSLTRHDRPVLGRISGVSNTLLRAIKYYAASVAIRGIGKTTLWVDSLRRALPTARPLRETLSISGYWL